jgi:arylsulfatase A
MTRNDKRPNIAPVGFLAAVFIAVAMIVGTTAAAAEKAPPNIVFLVIDDMGWPDVACYGHEFHETPVVDQLCADGVKFTDFYAATPVCSSTRSTIQSGQYSSRTAVTDFIPGHWRPFEKLVVPAIEHNLAEGIKTPGDALKAAGYATGYFGKWHLGDEKTHGPHTCGYEVTAQTMPKEFQQWRKTKDAGPKRMDLLTDQTLWFIEQNKERPFFVTLSHHAVHIRLEATPETIEKYEKKEKPDHGVNHPVYAAMTENLDTSIGRILDRLDDLGLADNTIVVFTSDNGGLRKIYTGVGEVVSTNAPLRDEKGTNDNGRHDVDILRDGGSGAARSADRRSEHGLVAQAAAVVARPRRHLLSLSPLPSQSPGGSDPRRRLEADRVLRRFAA